MVCEACGKTLTQKEVAKNSNLQANPPTMACPHCKAIHWGFAELGGRIDWRLAESPGGSGASGPLD